MTTKVVVSCPNDSHWDIKVTIKDRAFDFVTQKYSDEWRVADSFTLKPTESREVYVHSSRHVLVEEIDRAPS
jgi:hypothetical protein